MMATFVADEVWVYLFLKEVLKNSAILDVSELQFEFTLS